MKFRLCLFLLLTPLFYYFGGKFCSHQTDGFTLLKIQSTLRYDPRFETGPPPERLASLLDQPFTYLNSGGQCYAFLSQDKTVVLKLFKHHLRRVPWLFDHLPLPQSYAALRQKQREKRASKLVRDFTSYTLCFHSLQEESGLLYTHLNKTKELGLHATLIDKLGIAHSLDLDNFEFVLQKKADLALGHLQRLIEREEFEEAKKRIDSIFTLILSRCEKGIYDEDPRLHCNLGFLEDKAMLIDVGRLRLDESRRQKEIYKRDVEKMVVPLLKWLEKQSPQLAKYLEWRVKQL